MFSADKFECRCLVGGAIQVSGQNSSLPGAKYCARLRSLTMDVLAIYRQTALHRWNATKMGPTRFGGVQLAARGGA